MAQITIKDIAQRLNISPSTVSRALRGHPDISQKTRDRVSSFAAKYNYQPNQIAKSLQTRRTSTLGVIVPEIRHYFFSAVISGIEAVAYDAGFAIMVCQSNDTMEREILNTQVLASHRVAGMLVSVSQETSSFEHLEALQRQGIPMVFFDRVVKSVGASTVVVDDADGAYEAVVHLIQRGYKRIAHLAGVQAISVSRYRLEGYRRALLDHGMAIDKRYIVHGGFHERDGELGAAKLLRMDEPPDAIFCVNDPVAIGAFMHCREIGCRIPQDVALVGFSNNPVTALVDPPLTTVDQPAFEIGAAACNMLLEQFDSDDPPAAETRMLKTKLIVRGST